MDDTPAKFFMTFGTNHLSNDGESLHNRYALFSTEQMGWETRGPAYSFMYPIEELERQKKEYGLVEISPEEIDEGRRAE